jgi:hypothetical protein
VKERWWPGGIFCGFDEDGRGRIVGDIGGTTLTSDGGLAEWSPSSRIVGFRPEALRGRFGCYCGLATTMAQNQWRKTRRAAPDRPGDRRSGKRR